MTKSWEQVRELICRLYLIEGKSLATTRGLLADRGFVASDRSYRMKLKEWGLKRDDLSLEESSPNGLLQKSRFSTFDVPVEDSVLADIYHSLKQKRTTQDAYPLLKQSEQIINQLLLYSAAQVDKDSSATTHIVHYLMMTGFHFEHEALGKKALEIAIGKGNVDFVNVLLAAGASIDFGLLLHTFPPRATELGVLMLANGLVIDEQLLYEMKGHDKKTEITTHFQSWDIDPKVLGYCLFSCQRSFGHSSHFSAPLGDAYKDFVKSWSLSDMHHPVSCQLSANCLTVFLAVGCDPFIEFNAGLHCPSGRCKTLAALVLFHSTSAEYCRAVIESSAEKYVPDIIHCVLQPCPDRLHTARKESLSALIRNLLSRPNVNWNRTDLLRYLIRVCRSEDVEKLDLLRAILETRSTTTDIDESSGFNPVELLASAPEPLCWRLAEVLLSSHSATNKMGLVLDEDLTGFAQQLAQSPRDLDVSPWLSNYFYECVQTSYGFLKVSKNKEESTQLRRFFVHTCTKRLIGRDAHLLSAEQVCEIFRLREELELPSISVHSYLLTRLCGDKNAQ